MNPSYLQYTKYIAVTVNSRMSSRFSKSIWCVGSTGRCSTSLWKKSYSSFRSSSNVFP